MSDKYQKIKIEEKQQKLGIDICGSGIKSVLINKERNEIKYFYNYSDSVRNGLIINKDKFKKDILDTISKIANNNNNVIPRDVSISTSSYKMKNYYNERNIYNDSKDKIITNDLIQKYLDEIKETHNYDDSVVLEQCLYKANIDDVDIYKKDISGIAGRKIKINTITISEDIEQYNIIFETLEDIGIKNIDIISGPLADAAGALDKKRRLMGSASINIGRDNTSICIYENNLPVYISVLNIGSGIINNELIKKLKLVEEEAEAVLVNEEKRDNNKNKNSITNIINAEIDNISRHIAKDFTSANKLGLLPGGCVCSGGISKNKRMLESLRYNLKMPIYNSEEINNEKILKNIDPRYIRAVGSTRFVQNLEELEFIKRMIKNLFNIARGLLQKHLP